MRLCRLRRLSIMVVLPLVVACLASCLDDRREGPLRGEKLEVMAVWSADEQKAFRKVLDLFEQQTGAEVRYVPGGDDLSTMLQTRIRGGNLPNVAISPQPGVVSDLAKDGDIKPLDASLKDIVESNYSEFWRNLGRVDGKYYSVYFKAANKSTFWYHVQTLEDNGLKPPKTWDEFLGLCASLSRLGIPPVAVGAEDGWVLTDWFENVYLQAFGPDMYGDLSRHEIPWTHSSVRRTFEILAQILGKDSFIDGGAAGALQVDFPDAVVNVFGPQARAAMVYEGDFVAGVIKTHTKARLGKEANYFPFPTINDSAPAVVVGGDAAVALKDDHATMEFMRFLASREAGNAWARLGGFISPNNAVLFDAYPDDVTRKIAAQLNEPAAVLKFDMSDLYPETFGETKVAGMRKGMQDFLSNPDDIDGVMQRLERDALKASG